MTMYWTMDTIKAELDYRRQRAERDMRLVRRRRKDRRSPAARNRLG